MQEVLQTKSARNKLHKQNKQATSFMSKNCSTRRKIFVQDSQ